MKGELTMGYIKLLWGFIFLFDFRIQGFDILPDIIGYILFYKGLSELEDRNAFFAKGKQFALPLIIISLFDIYEFSVSLDELSISPYGIVVLLLGIISSVINLLMVYNICRGIGAEAEHTNHFKLASQATTAWNVYLIANILILSSFILLGILPILVIIGLFFSIVGYILMLRLMYNASHSVTNF